jgi:putative transcriptional regulator
MEIKSNLEEIMESMGMKQNFLASKVGISERTLSFIKRKKSVPSLLVALKIAKVLNKKVEDIWDLWEEKN